MPNNNQLRTAIIMAGGQGTRLASIIGPLPKAMANIRGTKDKYYGKSKDTILEHQIDVLSQNGINNFILVVGNKKEYIMPTFTNEIINNNVYTAFPGDRHINIKFFEEQAPLGTGGSFCSKELQSLIKDEDFLFTYSDVLFDVNVQDMFKFHKNQGANATISISSCPDPDDRVLCVFNKNSTEIVSMIPKQGKQDGPRGGLFPNTPQNGIIILNKSFLDVLPEDETYLDFEDNILMKLIYDKSYKVCGWQTPCYIKDIGVVSRFHEGVEELEQGVPAKQNPAKSPQSCVIFKESDLLHQDSSGKISLDSDMAYSISQLNSKGVISILEKDMSKQLNFSREDELIDTLLVRRQTPCYFDTKISDLSQINQIGEDWNISPENAFCLEKEENVCVTTRLLPSDKTMHIHQNVLSAVSNIIYAVKGEKLATQQEDENEIISFDPVSTLISQDDEQ